MIQTPRVRRNQESSRFVLPRESDRNAPVPASSMKVGAQICVIQRVKNNPGVVVAMFVGLVAVFMMKSRVWSSSMRAMMLPRSKSTESRRGRMEETAAKLTGSVWLDGTVANSAMAGCFSVLHLLTEMNIGIGQEDSTACRSALNVRSKLIPPIDGGLARDYIALTRGGLL